MSENIQIVLSPRRSAILSGHASKTQVLVRLRAPEVPADMPQRPPLNLALVIDRSGSMDGRPINEAVLAAKNVVKGLGPRDRLAIVAFNSTAEVLVSSRPVDEPEVFLSALDRIHANGNTALYDGWLLGSKEVAPHVGKDVISKVLLLSDGQANAGKTAADEIFADCAHLSGTGVYTSTFGLGDSFDERLLIGMATSGEGKGYFGKTATDLHDPFEEELGMLGALVAREVRLKLTPAPGVELSVRNEYRQRDGWHLMPLLSYGGEVWALVEATVPAGLEDPEDATRPLILAAKARFIDRHGERREAAVSTLRLERVGSAAFEAIVEDPGVARRAEELRAADLQRMAREASRDRDWRRAEELLHQAERECSNNPWVIEVIRRMMQDVRRRSYDHFGKSAFYAEQKMRNRQASLHERGDYSPEAQYDLPTYLRRKPDEGRDHRPGSST
jgi:Ca-activated chloride channel family protein